ncbi:uridine kinase [Aerococcaceae bacterium zg-ZJ1578]|uniref:uridine kinase n=1 Tax=Aerococcaceae TaxID=186827 RepID=UPI0013BDA3F6|nr:MULTISPECIES: uridine kinase [unclassified Facklamia]MBK0347361.1 uridine kinase [Aerococcaceae bacterium zg-1578]MBS4461873.1 uridine kinase [Aerococcaceae bacterium zg-B36]QQD66391.1 uridine kinase [Aerococcaceae bacterium zg-252]NEW63592.1 uridine kinase [Facklamia sp. 252]NEW67063.1 uridine kinase [Facklamia sp. 253]
MVKRPIVIGVTGASGSGKSSVSNRILDIFSELSVLLLQQDYYYKDQTHLPFEERLKTNYDHPFAFDNDLFIEHLQALLRGETIEKPVYDYANHTRSQEIIVQESRDVIIVEGILILEDPRIRELLDIKIYVDTDSDICLARRILRDINERGRTIESVINQYVEVVKPMYHQFIEPTKRYADLIIPEGGYNQVAIDLLATKVRSILESE